MNTNNLVRLLDAMDIVKGLAHKETSEDLIESLNLMGKAAMASIRSRMEVRTRFPLEGFQVDIKNFPRGYNKVPAIKALRSVFGSAEVGLKPAKDFVEQHNLFAAEGGIASDIPFSKLVKFADDNLDQGLAPEFRKD